MLNLCFILFFRECYFEHSYEEIDTKQKADDFCYRESEPHEVNVARKREKISRGDKDYQLSAEAYNHTVNAFAECLTGCGRNDRESCENESEADYSECYLTNGEHFLACVEKSKERFRDNLKDGKP